MRSGQREAEPEVEEAEEVGRDDGVALWGKVVLTVAPFLLLALLVAGLMLLD